MKRLVRSRQNRMVAGVLGGVAEYLDVDPTVIRLLYVFLFVITAFFPALIAYIIAVFIVPNE